jgi:hypothetical protein
MMAAAASHREPNVPKDNLSADQYIERILNQLAFSALLEPDDATEYNATAEDPKSTAPSR